VRFRLPASRSRATPLQLMVPVRRRLVNS